MGVCDPGLPGGGDALFDNLSDFAKIIFQLDHPLPQARPRGRATGLADDRVARRPGIMP
jgi:hypothetical protein